jgi:hypothetical protein
LATCIGGDALYIVSTVGEWFPSQSARECLAESRGIILEGMGDAREVDYMKKIGYKDIGYQRKYETMVFHAKLREDANGQCCPYECIYDGGELDTNGYNDHAEAAVGHYEMCLKWSKQECGSQAVRANG